MGYLWSFKLDHFIQQFGIKIMVETGTGSGDAVRYGKRFVFEEIYSIEVVAEQVEKLRPEFADDPRIHLIVGDSMSVLKELIPKLKSNTLFWLDAHFPGADLGLRTYGESSELANSFPLIRELEMIRDLRGGFRDVILIDDLRIYETDKFQFGNIRDNHDNWNGVQFPPDSRFLYTTLEKTHQCHRFLAHEGYFALLPKEEQKK
jgi:hypothetical protein